MRFLGPFLDRLLIDSLGAQIGICACQIVAKSSHVTPRQLYPKQLARPRPHRDLVFQTLFFERFSHEIAQLRVDDLRHELANDFRTIPKQRVFRAEKIRNRIRCKFVAGVFRIRSHFHLKNREKIVAKS
jgi:hypothetical protein